MVSQAVIWVGGRGERLRPLTDTTPKPLLSIHGKPFAQYLVELLKKNGIEEIIFLTGYLGEQFPASFGDGFKFDVRIKYSHTPLEDDTGERLKKAKDLLDEQFLLLYGDNYWPLNLEQLLSHHKKLGTPMTAVAYENQDPAKKNNMRVEDGIVTVYDKKRETSGLNGIDIGFFILEKSVVNLIPKENVNFEAAILPLLAKQKKLGGFLTKHPYWSLTTADRLPAVEQALNPLRKVLFLDRDGTLNKRQPIGTYITQVEQFEFLPSTIGALKKLTKIGYEFYLVTNQPGIARGDLSEETHAAIHKRMSDELAEHGVSFAGIYYCPHNRDSTCECRKPKPGMLYQAAREHNIDLSRAVFVGDDERDKLTGDDAGVKTILVPSDIGLVAALPELDKKDFFL